MQISLPDSIRRATHSRSLSGFEHQDKVLELLANATGVLAGGADYERAINCLASLMVKDFATWCTIDLLQEDGSVERVTAAHRDAVKLEMVRRLQTRYPASPKAKRGVYAAIETRQSIMLPHVSNEQWAERADDVEHLDLILELGSSSYMVVPLIARGQAVGAIMLLADDRHFDQQDLEAAEKFANWIAMVVDNISMFRKMKSAILELESTQSKLIQSSKMAAIGVMSAGLAHEINNPLAIIRLSAEKIKSLMPNPNPQIKDYFGRMEYGIDRIVRILNGVSDFSRTNNPSLSPVDMTDVLKKCVSLMKKEAKATAAKIELVSHHSNIIVNGSSPRLEHLFSHVLTNAVDAVNAKNEGGKVKIGLWKDASAARMMIEDDGPGIHPTIRDRIFEPFFSTKGPKGAGLGLSVAHGIVQDHNGEIKVESTSTNGTRVTIELPLLMP